MQEDKDKILDAIIEYEDKELLNVRKNVLEYSKNNFGDIGSKIAIKYYKQIDGEEDFDDIADDCNDCKERAQKLIETSEFLKQTTDLMVSDFYTQVTKDINIDIYSSIVKDTVIGLLDSALKKSCYKLSKEQKDGLIKRILLEIVKKEEPKK